MRTKYPVFNRWLRRLGICLVDVPCDVIDSISDWIKYRCPAILVPFMWGLYFFPLSLILMWLLLIMFVVHAAIPVGTVLFVMWLAYQFLMMVGVV